jgi:hypothetical protein
MKNWDLGRLAAVPAVLPGLAGDGRGAALLPLLARDGRRGSVLGKERLFWACSIS